MDLTPYITSLQRDLQSAAAVGDEATQRAAAALAAALGPAARLAIMNALSNLADEVTGSLTDTTVELRLDGQDVRVTVTEHTRAEPAPEGGHSWTDQEGGYHYEYHYPGGDLRAAMKEAGGELSRTTVRLFNDLKTQAEQAASDQGVSLNTYISHAVSDAVRGAVPSGGKGKGKGKSRPGGRNITGFIQS